MSQENVELALRAIRAWNDRDVEALVAVGDPDGEMLLPRNLLEGGSYRGLDGIRQAVADAFATWEASSLQVEGTRDAGDQIVILGRAVNVAKGGGPRVDYELAVLMATRRGKIVYWRPFLSHAEALEAVGLQG
jgi:ketosteroid isomerase-like protein